ncbi:MAG: hypothetical protein ACFE9L_04820, partial [Candidatus Hodarchaeota archaeon]
KKIPGRIKNRLNLVKFVREMKDSVTELINMPIRERKSAHEIETVKSLEKLSDIICEYLFIRTFHVKLCTRLLDILLNNKKAMDELIHSYFTVKSLEKDSGALEIDKDMKKDCSNLFLALTRNPKVNVSNINFIIEKSIDKLVKKQKDVIESSNCYKLTNTLVNTNSIMKNVNKNLLKTSSPVRNLLNSSPRIFKND